MRDVRLGIRLRLGGIEGKSIFNFLLAITTYGSCCWTLLSSAGCRGHRAFGAHCSSSSLAAPSSAKRYRSVSGPGDGSRYSPVFIQIELCNGTRRKFTNLISKDDLYWLLQGYETNSVPLHRTLHRVLALLAIELYQRLVTGFGLKCDRNKN